MFVYRCELPYFLDITHNYLSVIPPALQVSPSYITGQQLVTICLLKLLPMFASKVISLIVSLVCWNIISGNSTLSKGINCLEKMVMCVKM